MKEIIKLILPNYFKKIYYKIKSFYECLFFKINLKNYIKKKKPIFIIVGAGTTKYKKWLSTNYPWFNLIELKSYKKYFQSRNVEKILAEHVFEHLTLEEGKKAINNLKEILKPNGKIRIAVPDGFNPDKKFIDWVRPNGLGPGADDHKVLYNYKLIHEIFDEDFEIKYLEYFNEKSEFIYTNWTNNSDNGYIMRSRYEDKRNTNEEIKYNSIIVDAILKK
jgi:predicted SAM-dependent methyltransferase